MYINSDFLNKMKTEHKFVLGLFSIAKYNIASVKGCRAHKF